MKNLFYTAPKYLQNLKGIKSSASEIDGSVNLAHPSLTHFLTKLNKEEDHLTVFVNGDSTGDAMNEWVYFFALWLGDAFPNYNIIYRDWNNSLNDYDTTINVHKGTNGFNINVFNACTGSQPVYYLMNESKKANSIINIIDQSIYPNSSKQVDLTIVNHSHNHYGETLENQLLYWNALFTEEFIRIHPRSSFIVIKQNPWRDSYDNKLRVDKSIEWANIKGVCIADAWEKFESLGKGSDLYLDNVHPSIGLGDEASPTGTKLFLEAVIEQLKKNPSKEVFFPKSHLNKMINSYNFNPNLYHDDGDNLPPTGYLVTGGNCKKDTTIYYDNKKKYSTKITSTGGSNCFFRLRLDQSNGLDKIKGKNILIAIMVRFDYTESIKKNIMQISTTSSGHKLEKNLSHLTGGWNWRFVPCYVSPSDESLNVYININTLSSTPSGEFCHIDKIIVTDEIEPFGNAI